METNTEQDTSQTTVKEKQAIFRVTPLSKYLAMVLFIAMPFIGGWIGYIYAPEKIVEIEKIVVVKEKSDVSADQTEYQFEEFSCDYIEFVDDVCYKLLGTNAAGERIVLIDDITEAFRIQSKDSNSALGKIYFPVEQTVAYFKSFIPNSDGCCGISRFDFKTQEFTQLKGYGPAMGEIISPSGRYVLNTNGKTIEIRDLETEFVAKVDAPDAGILWATNCALGGSATNFEWINDTTLKFGIYENVPATPEDICENRLIEFRTVDIAELDFKAF